MKNLLENADRDALIARLQNLRPNSQARWGVMTAGQIVPHLTDPLCVAIGDRPAQPMNSVFSNPVVSFLTVWWLPWPKSAPTAAEFIPGKGGTPPAEFERDKQALLLAIHRFAQYPENDLFRPNPVFGRLSRRAWGRLMWRHIDHHLRQFGL
ncbi:MAG: DUF1569 domain-containing protein [Lewinellaceae bacterium]|nr:DUF1569 domain-containing protein [Lewinellaceae bacterium]